MAVRSPLLVHRQQVSNCVSFSKLSQVLLRLFFFAPIPTSLQHPARPPSRASLAQPVEQYCYPSEIPTLFFTLPVSGLQLVVVAALHDDHVVPASEALPGIRNQYFLSKF